MILCDYESELQVQPYLLGVAIMTQFHSCLAKVASASSVVSKLSIKTFVMSKESNHRPGAHTDDMYINVYYICVSHYFPT